MVATWQVNHKRGGRLYMADLPLRAFIACGPQDKMAPGVVWQCVRLGEDGGGARTRGIMNTIRRRLHTSSSVSIHTRSSTWVIT